MSATQIRFEFDVKLEILWRRVASSAWQYIAINATFSAVTA